MIPPFRKNNNYNYNKSKIEIDHKLNMLQIDIKFIKLVSIVNWFLFMCILLFK